MNSSAKNPDERSDTPVLITEAAPSFNDEQAARKRKYLTMMGLRLPCLFLALIFAQVSWWLALGFLVLSIPLPWAAVLIANDRPPRKAKRFKRYKHEQGVPSTTVLERSNNHQIIEG